MQAHKYELKIYEGALDWTHGMHQTQTRIYIPNTAVFGFRDKEEIDFFSEKIESFRDAQKVINGEDEGKYLGEIEIPDDKYSKFALAGRALNDAKADFKKASKSLLEILRIV